MQAPLLKNELWKILKKRWKYNYIGITKPSICNTLHDMFHGIKIQKV